MKLTFSLPVKETKARLAALKTFVNQNSVLPILSDVFLLVSQKEKKIKIAVTDLETWAETTFDDIPCKGEGMSCIDHKQFLKFFTDAEADKVQVEITTDKVEFTDGDFSASVQTDNTDNYPKKWEFEKIVDIIHIEQAENFKTGIQTALKISSDDDLRPAMTGANLEWYKGGLVIVSTDAHRLYIHKLTSAIEFPNRRSTILPKQLLKFLSTNLKGGEVKISVGGDTASGEKVIVKYGPYEITSRLIDANYPNWAVVVPDCRYSVKLNRATLMAKLKRAKPMLNNSTKMIEMAIDGSKAEFNGGDVDFSTTAKFHMEAIDNNTPGYFKIAFNCEFLLEALSIHKDELVVINHNGDANKAAMVGDDMLLMPLMLNN